MEGELSRNPDGRVQLQYTHSSGRRTVVWEPIKEGVAETIFDDQGAVLRQSLVPGTTDIDKRLALQMRELLKEANVDKVRESAEYNEIKLKKNCPACGTDTLSQYREKVGGMETIPIVPTYLCGKCNGRSYYLTDQYLDQLVSTNKELFSEQELSELRSNKEAFMSELKEYIIRIFASKKIIRIK